MDYRILITPIAALDLSEHMELISKDSPEQGRKWLEGAWDKIFALQNFPHRNALSQEGKEVGVQLREIFHYSHRIIYRVHDLDGTVEVLRVWHQARRAIQSTDLN